MHRKIRASRTIRTRRQKQTELAGTWSGRTSSGVNDVPEARTDSNRARSVSLLARLTSVDGSACQCTPPISLPIGLVKAARARPTATEIRPRTPKYIVSWSAE